MASTLHDALEARGIDTLGQLVTEVEGDFIDEARNPDIPGLLNKYPRHLLDKVRFNFRFKVPPGKREEAEQAVNGIEQNCTVHKTLQRGIDMSYTWDIQEEDQG